VNWDDDGAELRPAAGGAPVTARGITCPNCGAPGQTGRVCSLCHTPLAQVVDESELDPALRGVVFAPAPPEQRPPAPAAAAAAAMAPAPALSEPFTPAAAPGVAAPEPLPPAPASAYAEVLQPVARRGSLVLLLGTLILIAGLLIAASAWLGAQSEASHYDGVVQSFFEAHLRKDYAAAGGYLAPPLQPAYTQAKDITDLNLTAKLGALAAPQVLVTPLAAGSDSNAAEALVTVRPQTGTAVHYRVHLTHASGTWLIDGVFPDSGP